MALAFSAVDPWKNYLAAMTAGVPGDAHVEVEATLERMMEEHRATKGHLDILERNIAKMLGMEQDKLRSEYEVAQRKLMLLEKEGNLVRKVIPGVRSSGDEISGMHFYEGKKPGRVPLPELDFMNDFSVSFEDATRGRHDVLDPGTRVPSDDASPGIRSRPSEDDMDVINGSHNSHSLASENMQIEQATVSPNHGSPLNPLSTEKQSPEEWIRSKTPKELREFQAAIQKALIYGREGEELEGRARRRLSKRHRFKPKTEIPNSKLVTPFPPYT